MNEMGQLMRVATRESIVVYDNQHSISHLGRLSPNSVVLVLGNASFTDELLCLTQFGVGYVDRHVLKMM